ncbi:MAG: TonB family protein [Chloracidobacterium sp.]|nr:TonB family protein [Chloracidobacterium sp.]
MKCCLLLIIFLTAFNLRAQTSAQSPELVEAEQLSAKVVKLYKSGKYDEALPLAERALALREKALGSDNELVAAALRNLAEVQLAKKMNKETEATYDRYISVLEKLPGKNDSTLINSLDRYVCLLTGIKNVTKSKEIQKRLYKLDNKFDFDDAENKFWNSEDSTNFMADKQISWPKPAYPAEAKLDRAQGPVVLKIIIDEKGKVIDAKAICGHPLLVRSAMASLKQAQYKPTIIFGKPVKITAFANYFFIF